jgi:serpin B
MSTPPVSQPNTATDAQVQFGLTLVQRVASTATGTNVVVSPFGVLAAFALALSGADGSTRAALATALFGSPTAVQQAETAFAGYLHQLLHPKRYANEGSILALATSLWTNEGFALTPAFIERAQALYEAQASTLDFTDSSAATRINDWVKAHTQGKIADIVSAADLQGPPLPKIVLLSAVYFQAKWNNEFAPRATRSDWFRQANGTRQEAKFMHKVSHSIGYQVGNGWRAVTLSYSSYPRRYAMRIFVPDELSGLPAFLNTLEATTWAQWHQNFHQGQVEVDLSLPRFRIEWSADLVPTLRQMGLADALGPGANFSAMGFRDEEGGGFIGSVVHKTYLAVDEEGTEAAAVTAMIGIGGGRPVKPEPMPRVVVKVDSPFFYAIVDQQDATILFAGIVNELVQD